jgi:murein DD-endopeptidase MepM/ murein hydrolase activator NlpD
MQRRDDLLGYRKESRARGLGKKLFYSVAVAILAGGIVYLVPRFEWHAPVVKLNLASTSVGRRPFDIEVTDEGRGLATVAATLSVGGVDHPLFIEHYGLGTVKEKKITIALAPDKIAVEDGPAVLQVKARDRSYWRFFRGNEAVWEKSIVLDRTPPKLELISDDPYVNFGGSGVVIYKTSPDTQKSGVQVARYFFPGYKIKEPDLYVAFFAHAYDLNPADKAVILAEDEAGNAAEMSLSYTLKGVRYKKSTITIDDTFIETKAAPLLGADRSHEQSLMGAFLKVNRDLRKANEATIKALCAKSSAQILWQGPFQQLRNSKVEANFADERTYVYQGETIDHAYHLGFDLAVTRNAPVEAANNGVVVFAADLGIYGNTVILDHGMGVFTLYSHLSSIEVKTGDTVKQKEIIGKTGETGLAAGDHLHYATLVHGVPVLPVEWWDGKWIKDNVQSKLDDL